MIITRTPFRISFFGGMCYNGYMGRPLANFKTEEAVSLYDEGRSCHQIASQFSVSFSAVWRRLKPLGILRDRGAGNRGKKLREEHCKAISEGRKRLLSDPTIRQKLLGGSNNPFYGHKHKPEMIANMKLRLSELLSGSNNPQWKGGKSFEPYSSEFKRIIRHQVYERDGYKCKICSITHKPNGGRLVAHHKDIDKQNCGIDNLITLCRSCHGKITMATRWSKEVVKIL